jgi:hypothetical protein
LDLRCCFLAVKSCFFKWKARGFLEHAFCMGVATC